jgi:hypothetical protein
MEDMMVWIGRIAGAGGALIWVIAAAVRLSGRYFFSGFQVGTLLQVGIAAMILGCFCFLAALTARR